MKFVRGISLFFIYPMVMVGIGFSAGVLTMDFFYPNTYAKNQTEWQSDGQGRLKQLSVAEERFLGEQYAEDGLGEDVFAGVNGLDSGILQEESLVIEVAMTDETLNADTEYVLQEVDLTRNTMVETTRRIPGEYMGMNRKQFLESMEDYEAFPPLSELERGFVSLEIISFSSERVTVQMNYLYVQPSESFYLAVRNNEVIVLLEDKETVFINTGIMLTVLPEAVQLEIIQMLWVENEEELYDFLEHYSS